MSKLAIIQEESEMESEVASVRHNRSEAAEARKIVEAEDSASSDDSYGSQEERKVPKAVHRAIKKSTVPQNEGAMVDMDDGNGRNRMPFQATRPASSALHLVRPKNDSDELISKIDKFLAEMK